MNMGISNEQIDFKNSVNALNDTSLFKYEFVSWSPTFSYTHEFVIGPVLSLSGKVGFQYINLFYNDTHYGSPYAHVSVNPRVSIFYRRGFEYYMKLSVGVSFLMHQNDIIPQYHERYFPDRVNFFTGVTLGGFNYFVSDNWGLNLELSIWSPELATFGVNYRFFRGIPPKIIDYEDEE